MQLRKFLSDKGYLRIKLTLTRTNHFEVKGTINGVEGTFIVDTGASSTCIGMDCAERFGMRTEDSDVKAAGAGAVNMSTLLSRKNELVLGDWKLKKLRIVLFDLRHVNQALVQHQADPVQGIIGADVLKRARAVIDYQRKELYLKPPKTS